MEDAHASFLVVFIGSYFPLFISAKTVTNVPPSLIVFLLSALLAFYYMS